MISIVLNTDDGIGLDSIVARVNLTDDGQPIIPTAYDAKTTHLIAAIAAYVNAAISGEDPA